MISQEQWRQAVLEAGFQVGGVTGPTIEPGDRQRLDRWLHLGYQAEMDWIGRTAPLRREPARFLPAARSVLMVGLNTWGPAPVLPGGGRIARHARGRDYHRVFRKRLDSLARTLASMAGSDDGGWRRTTDIHPVLERALARQAGVGWPGSQSQLIHPRFGPWLLLGGIFLPHDLERSPACREECGTCRACLEACPTGAIVEPGLVDSGRCLAYLTIETTTPLPAPLRRACGDRLFGCDTCLEACPRGRQTPEQDDPDQADHQALGRLDLGSLLTMDEETFSRTFTGTPLRRAGRVGLVRNGAMVAANLDRQDLAPRLAALLEAAEPTLRSTGAWALGVLGRGGDELARALTGEGDRSVQQEIQAALEGF